MAVFSYKDNAMPQDAIRELSVTRLVIFETDKEVSPILLSCVSAAITRAEAINISPVYRCPVRYAGPHTHIHSVIVRYVSGSSCSMYLILTAAHHGDCK
jgi:hypothetical protein